MMWKGMPMKRLLLFSLIFPALLAAGCLAEMGAHLVELEIKPAPGGLINRPLRPQGANDIRYIMLHAISDCAENPTDPFQMERIEYIFRTYQVEAHYVIDREGQIYQFVEDACEARHAGSGTWAGDPKLTNKMNRYSIGIELLGIGTAAEMESVIGPEANALIRIEDRGYTQAQYLSLDLLLEHLMDRYAIPPENILTHRQYAPDRKWDPGELFAWPTSISQ